jgi:hypothetical protein
MSSFRLAISVGILLAIGLRFLLPIFDHNAAEHDPWHSHIVVGARDVRQYVQALAHHQHGNQPPQAEKLPLVSEGNVHVYNVKSQPYGQVTAFGVEVQTGFVIARPPSVNAMSGIWQTECQMAASGETVALPQPTPPPRFSSSFFQ